MPVHLETTRREEQEARIELVPMIDIVFFVLAIFMLISLNMVHLNTLKVNLPTIAQANPETYEDNLLSLLIDENGNVFLEETLVAPNELATRLQERFAHNSTLRVLIRGDRDARHGHIVSVLDTVRKAGIQNVDLETRPEPQN